MAMPNIIIGACTTGSGLNLWIDGYSAANPRRKR